MRAPHRQWLLLLIVALAFGCTVGDPRLPGLAPATATSPPTALPGAAPASPTPFQPLPAGTEWAENLLVHPVLSPTPTASPTPEATPTAPAAPTASPPAPSPTPELSSPTPSPDFTLWADPRLPPAYLGALNLPAAVGRAASPDTAMLQLQVGDERPISQWVYALAAPFPTLVDGMSSEMLRQSWSGAASGPFAGQPLLLDDSTLASFSALWGDPAPQAVRVLAAQELLDYAWKHQPTWALIPFESIEPRWKVLEVDGQSPLRKDFDSGRYPLTVPISLVGEPPLVETILSAYGQSLVPAANRDPAKLTVLAMTGVTALVRGTAYAMERKGINYPARDIGQWLREADLTHISNEVPFAEDCPYPDPVQKEMKFCSDADYIELLETVGTDIVELTGDHFQDWGAAAMRYTLDLYKERGWLYYGGGADLEEGRQALLIEHNGNRLAFIGCNAKGGAYAQAGPNRPGAVFCNLSWMGAEIERLKSDGYLPITTFQHVEYYTYKAQPNQLRDFRKMAQAGAVIVSGSQAHQPQALEFLGGAFIHYGLGNLFFDQYEVSLETRQAFIDRHIFYGGRYLGAELLTMLFVDFARPRPMTSEERLDLLRAVFRASGW